MSGIRPRDCSKLAINQQNDNDVIICLHDHEVIFQFFWQLFVSILKFRDWSKFHVNIITTSGVMTNYFYLGLTTNLEIGNTPVWVLLNIWRLGWVRDSKSGTDVSKEMLLNAENRQGYNFYRSWVIKGKTTGGGRVKLPLSSLRLGLTMRNWFRHLRDAYHYLWKVIMHLNFHALRKVREETNWKLPS